MRYFNLALAAVLAAFALTGAPAAFAQSMEATLPVSTAIPVQACRFMTADAAPLAIGHNGTGEIDPSSGVNATGSSSVDYECGLDITPEFTCVSGGSGCGQQIWSAAGTGAAVTLVHVSDPAHTITAQVDLVSGGPGAGYGVPVTAPITGEIFPAWWDGKKGGGYETTLVLGIRTQP